MKLFNFYKPLRKHPVLVTSLALTIPFVVTAVLAPAEEAKRNEYVGYIENFHCTSCKITRDGQKDPPPIIAPYQLLQAGDKIKVKVPKEANADKEVKADWVEVRLKNGNQIKIHQDHWIEVKLENNKKKEEKSSQLPYTVPENTDAFSSEFSIKTQDLIGYFDNQLYQSDMNESDPNQPNPQGGQPPSSDGKKAEKLKPIDCSPKAKKTSDVEKTLKETISCETGLSQEAKHTLLAGLLVMQKESNWDEMEKNVLDLLKGMNYERKGEKGYYYPASLVKKELDKVKKELDKKTTTAPETPKK